MCAVCIAPCGTVLPWAASVIFQGEPEPLGEAEQSSGVDSPSASRPWHVHMLVSKVHPRAYTYVRPLHLFLYFCSDQAGIAYRSTQQRQCNSHGSV